MYHPSKGLHVRCVTIGRQLDTATASVRLFTLHSSLFTHKKKPLCPPRYRWISPGTQKKEEQKALNPPHRDFSECKFITFSPNDKETKPEIAHYYIFTIHHHHYPRPYPHHKPDVRDWQQLPHQQIAPSVRHRVRCVTSGYKLEAADIRANTPSVNFPFIC